MTRVLITPRSLSASGHPSFDCLREAGIEVAFGPPGKQPSEEDLLRLLPGCAGMLAGVEPISAAVLEAASPGLKIIARNGVGIDNIDPQAAERLGIRVCPALGANARGVAELAVGLMFSLVRAIPPSCQALKSGQWTRFKGIELAGKTLGVVGCGAIGREVVRMALALDMNVIGYDIYENAELAALRGFRYLPLETLLAESHVITLHCPARSDGRPVIDAEALARVRRGAYLINTARASLLDPLAVNAALDDGRLSGVAVDVFDVEPPRDDDPLVVHDKVIVTPHIGAFTAESVDRAVEIAVECLLETLK